MNFKVISRKEKEDLFIKKMTELQLRWKNNIDDDWDAVKTFSDEQLEKGIADAVGQLRFEKIWSGLSKSIGLIVGILIGLGIIGLLIFGIKQII